MKCCSTPWAYILVISRVLSPVSRMTVQEGNTSKRGLRPALLCLACGCFGLCLLVVPVSAAEDSARRVFFEDGFEEPTTWRTWPGGRQRGEIVAEAPRRGATCLKLHSGPKPVLYVYIKVRQHTRYTASFWLKSKDSSGRFGLNLNFNRKGGGNGSAGKRSLPLDMPKEQDGWKLVEASFTTPPATGVLQLGLDFTRTSGEVWLDDVTVDEVEILRGPQRLVPFLKTTTPKVAADRAVFLFTTSADHTASASPDMPSMITFKNFGKIHKPRLVLDLPNGFRLLNGIRYLTVSPPTPIVREGKAFSRYIVSQSRPAGWFRLFWTTSLAPDTTTSVFYWAEWDGGRQEERRLPVEIVAIPSVSPPKHLITYLSVPCDLAIAWPNYGQYRAMGLNTLDIWPYTRNREDWAIRMLDEVTRRARAKEITVGAWPGEWWWREARTQDVDAQAMLVDGKRCERLCPSYRGSHYRSVLDHGMFLADKGIGLHVFDPEIYRHGDDICFCPRCQKLFKSYWEQHHPQVPFVSPTEFERMPEKYPEQHVAWGEFKTGQHAEMFAQYALEVRRHLVQKQPDKALALMAYTTYHKDWDSFFGYEDFRKSPVYTLALENPVAFAQCFDVIAPMIYPDIYAKGGSYDMLLPWQDVVSWRRLIGGKARVAPLLSAGFPFHPYHCDLSPQMVKWQIFEAVAGGAVGFGFWGVCPLDARDMRSIRDAVATILPVEDLLVSGKPASDFTALDGRVFVKGIRSKKGTVVLVSEYSNEPKQDRIKCPVTRPTNVYSLPDMQLLQNITPANPVFDVHLGVERAKLLLLREIRP